MFLTLAGSGTCVKHTLKTSTGRLDVTKIIDITAVMNARLMKPSELLWSNDIMGLRLVSDGANEFKGKCCLYLNGYKI